MSFGDKSTLKAYLGEITKTPLLTRGEELILAKTIERGLWAQLTIDTMSSQEAKNKLVKEKNLDGVEARRLEKLIAQGDQSAKTLIDSKHLEESFKNGLPDVTDRDKLNQLIIAGNKAKEDFTMANLLLVVSIAKPYWARSRLSPMDLIQEGNIGLMTAVTKFDYRRGYRFSTYATWWIIQKTRMAPMLFDREIRIPMNLQEMRTKVIRAIDEHHDAHNTNPDNQQIAEKLGISITKVERALRVPSHTTSLDRPLEVGGETGHDITADPKIISSDEALSTDLKMERIQQAIEKSLKKREAEIIIQRYGLDGQIPKSLTAVARGFSLSRERIRQIQADAETKMKEFDKTVREQA